MCEMKYQYENEKLNAAENEMRNVKPINAAMRKWNVNECNGCINVAQ